MRYACSLLLPALLLASLVPWSRSVGAEELDPAQASTAVRSDPVTYDVDFSVVVTPPYHTQVLKVWLPLPQSDHGQEVSPGKLSSFPLEVRPRVGEEPVFGNRFAYFEFHQPRGAQIVRHRFQVKVWQLDWNLQPDRIRSVRNWPDAFAPYLRGESQAVVVDERFSRLLDDILPDRGNPLEDFNGIMDWVIRDFRYDHGKASLQASSLHGLNQRCGHCSDYHGFCASLGRVLGYPTRMTYGIAAFPKNSPSHCKLEVFLPPYGWVSFDVSETQKLLASISRDERLDEARKQRLREAARGRLARGFRENTWFLQTRGSDYELVPPASRRVAVVRTAYVEADGEPLPEPDPANPEKREFAWMTVHKFTANREVANPFKDLTSLDSPAE